MMRRFVSTLCVSKFISVILGGGLLVVATASAELPVEPIPNVLKLDTPYPPTYAMVHDFSFEALLDARYSLVDVETRRYKGMLTAGQFANLNYSIARQKFYVGETIHTRLNRGDRQDLIAIYDFENLALQKEIEIPPKRMNVVVNLSASVITSDDQFLLVFNMNPATSVTVINLDEEEVVNEIQLPGCSLLYPDDSGGFFTLCGNGGLLHVNLNEDGSEASRWASKSFNDIDADPLSEKATKIGDTWYFVTYKGEVQPIEVSGKKPRLKRRWWIADKAEREANWRPAGWHGKATFGDQLFIGMTPNGYNGSHKDPATHVWQVDVDSKKIEQRIELKVMGLSIAATKGGEDSPPRLLVVNIEGSLDVYDAASGEYLHSINQLGDTPYIVHPID